MSPQIKLYFFGDLVDKFMYHLSFQKKFRPIKKKNKNYDIPESIFKNGKGKTTISITLKFLNEEKEHKFFVYYGTNKVYIQLNILNDFSYEIIFKKTSDKTIQYKGKKFTQLDTMGNDKLERLVLINYEYNYLFINEFLFNIQATIKNNCSIINSNFYQLTELDLNNLQFIVKPIEDKDEFDVKFFEMNKEKINSFPNELEKLFESSDDEYDDTLKKLRETFSDLVKHKSLNFVRTNEYLNNIFEQNNFLDEQLFYDYFLCRYFLDNENDFKKNNRYIIKSFLDYIDNTKDKILSIENVTKFEKIRALNVIFCTNAHFRRQEEITFLNLKVVNTPESEKNSIIYKVYNFFDEFIKGLSYDSIIFQSLLYLDGGIGFYKNEPVYCYDLCNLEMIKSHLKEILPEIIIFYSANNEEKAFTMAEFGGVCINETNLLKNIKSSSSKKYINYNFDTSLNEEEKDDIAMDIVIYLIHEVFGHKKFAFSENGINSPKKVVNSNNKIIGLKYKGGLIENDKENEYILESNNEKGDSGHFLELAYGKYENALLIKLLLDMKNKGKLIYRPDLFTDSGEKLREYVTLRIIAKKKMINLNFKKDLTIENEIDAMKDMIKNKDKNIKDEISSHENEKSLLQRKTKRNDDDKNENEENNCSKKKKLSSENNDKNLDSKYEEKSISELLEIFPYDEVVKIVKERVIQKFSLKVDIFIKKKLYSELQKLSSKDSYYNDIIFLISYYNKKI